MKSAQIIIKTSTKYGMVLLVVDHSHIAAPAVYTEYGKLHCKWRGLGASVRSKNRSIRVPRAYLFQFPGHRRNFKPTYVPHFAKYVNSSIHWDSMSMCVRCVAISLTFVSPPATTPSIQQRESIAQVTFSTAILPLSSNRVSHHHSLNETIHVHDTI